MGVFESMFPTLRAHFSNALRALFGKDMTRLVFAINGMWHQTETQVETCAAQLEIRCAVGNPVAHES